LVGLWWVQESLDKGALTALVQVDPGMIAKGVGGGALHAGDGEVGERDPLEGGSALEEALLFRADSSFDAGLFGRWRPDLSPM